MAAARQHQAEVAIHIRRCASSAQRFPERLFGFVRLVRIELHDGQVVPGECVGVIERERLAVRVLRLVHAGRLMLRDAALVPQLGTRLLQLEQARVDVARLGIALHERHLGFRLLHQERIFAALRCQPELAHRFVVQRLLTERETEVVVRERRFFRALGSLRRSLARPVADQLLVARFAVAIQRQVRFRLVVRRIQLGSFCSRSFRARHVAEIAIDEREQVMRFGQVRLARDGALEIVARFHDRAAVVQHFAEVQQDARVFGLELRRAPQRMQRRIEVAVLPFGAREIEQQPNIIGAHLQQPLPLADRARDIAAVQVCAREPLARAQIARIREQLRAQVRDETLVIARVEVRDLQVAVGHLHALIELERFLEVLDRFLVQSLVVEDHAEVVVRAGVARIDAAGERAQNLEVALRAR